MLLHTRRPQIPVFFFSFICLGKSKQHDINFFFLAGWMGWDGMDGMGYLLFFLDGFRESERERRGEIKASILLVFFFPSHRQGCGGGGGGGRHREKNLKVLMVGSWVGSGVVDGSMCRCVWIEWDGIGWDGMERDGVGRWEKEGRYLTLLDSSNASFMFLLDYYPTYLLTMSERFFSFAYGYIR
ncbi:uncharacterized protein MYCFIDRAFT_206463 [Pseudocercospora fijiensis CIRAD86]|uniref:Uncharacterized protein n=1 Tax=Pseudocercospora fijiensis (strain CIRAD86) TaxID=383855 RepID=M3B7K6_PSEFD|nr:uncharacterized protein MYCFIDRAFT_206463 [Pseudocercospora fijiensis CIRAD86]EME85287.1 hypothetical protein MYCFIDRAFT_206463 [Pseudocercospora fijiensis CIRAD86]